MNEQQNEKKSGGRVNTATKLINRVIRYMLHYYKYPFLLVIVCILITCYRDSGRSHVPADIGG